VPLPPGVLTRIGSSRLRHWTTDVAVAPDGRTIASAGIDGVRVWDIATGKLVNVPVIVRDRWARPAIAYAANGDLLCSLRRPLSLLQRLDPATGRERFRVELDAVADSDMWFAESGGRFAYRHKDQSLRIVDTGTGRELSVLRNVSPQLSDIAFSPDDLTLAVADNSDTISLFDTATGLKIGEAKHAECIFNSVMISPDGRTIAARRTRPEGPPYEIHFWDFPTGKYRAQLPAEDTKQATEYRFSPDGKTLLTAGILWAMPTLWDVGTCKKIRRFHGVPGVMTVVFSPNGKTLVGAGRGAIVLWDVETGRLLPASAEPPISIRGLRYADDGRQLIGISDRVAAWDPETGREVRHWARVPYGRGFITLSPDQRLLATVDDAGMMRLWDAATGREVRKLGGDHHIVSEDSLFTPDGRQLIGADTEKRIVVWDVLSGKQLATLSGHNGRVSDLAISADGRKLASVSPAAGVNDIRVWDLTKYQEIRRFAPRRGQVFTAAFSPDGRFLATSGGVRDVQETLNSGDVDLWDLETGRGLRSMTGHTWVVTRLAFSPDGRMLATGSGDDTVRLWEVATGAERHRFTGHSTYISSLAFAPDGRELAAASDDAPVYIWDVFGLAQPLRPVMPTDLEQAWTNLESSDAKVAFQTICRLVAVRDVAVDLLLKQKLKPASLIESKSVQELIRQLDSPRFTDRLKALSELEKLGDRAAAELRTAVKKPLADEIRQAVQRLLDAIDAGTPETLRAIRAVEVLEHIATPAARELLKTLAAGQPGAEPTPAAAAALQRLDKRP
jgi:WD40 repeat protein